MRPAITRVPCLTAAGAALALLGLTGVTAPAGAAGVAGTAAPPVTVYVANQGSGTVTPIRRHQPAGPGDQHPRSQQHHGHTGREDRLRRPRGRYGDPGPDRHQQGRAGGQGGGSR